MSETKVTILGAGNTGYATAAQLALSGFDVALGELPEFKVAIEPILAWSHR